MSLGIRAFGNDPILAGGVCALLGTMMVPCQKCFMWAVSRNSYLHLPLLLVFDFMHFTLSRIGTIDIIVACFILLTFLSDVSGIKSGLKHGIDRCTFFR